MVLSNSGKVVVLGTGGTIAGTATAACDNIGYTAAQVGVAQLLDAVAGLNQVLAGRVLQSEQVAQIDSKDMSHEIWQALAARVSHHLAQDDVSSVVVTHGTDTLEETAFFLHAVLPEAQLALKPVVLVCAMRPASALAPDGPQNLLDAVSVATTPGACGVVVVCAGVVHGGREVQKVHTYRTDAFDSGDAGPLGYVEEGQVRLVRAWPSAQSTATAPMGRQRDSLALVSGTNVQCWPRVEIVMSYAGASGATIDALLAPSCTGAAVQGLVIAATGNGTIHQALQEALHRAHTAGVQIVRSTRCSKGRVLSSAASVWQDSDGLSPVKARVALMLRLLEQVSACPDETGSA